MKYKYVITFVDGSSQIIITPTELNIDFSAVAMYMTGDNGETLYINVRNVLKITKTQSKSK